MSTVSTLATLVLEQHHAAVERLLRIFSKGLEADGRYIPGRTPLHDLLKTSTTQNMKAGYISTRISIIRRAVRQPGPGPESWWESAGTVSTRLDGNLWTTLMTRGWDLTPPENREETKHQEKPQPPHLSGGSALYGSPQDATENKIRQPPAIRDSQGYIWNIHPGQERLGTFPCRHCGQPLDRFGLCPCQAYPGHGAG